MAQRDDGPPDTPNSSARGSSTRRRLLSLLGALPVMVGEGIAAGRLSPHAAQLRSIIDPMPRLFAEFEGLLERHQAALACCDHLEATLLAQIDYPRVPLPADWDGSQREAVDALTIAPLVPPGRHRRRLQRLLQRQQGRWDEAAYEVGLTTAQEREAALDTAVLNTAASLLATPAWTLNAVVLKLLVLLSTQEPGPSACATSPWRELRLILLDLEPCPRVLQR